MPPPRTLKPVAPSPTVLTPGSSKMLRTTSTSPSSGGIFLMVRILSLEMLICVVDTLRLAASPVTTTSRRRMSALTRSTFRAWLPRNTICRRLDW